MGGNKMCKQMKWDKLLTEKRFHSSEKDDKEEENGRSPFEKDIDRITFSGAFRRLGRKTQVHLLSKNDNIHTRLSHSLEVACVGRSLGVMVGEWLEDEKKSELPADFSRSKIGEIVEAACLAHDIGNPPFGHAAEDAIRKWFQENMPSEYKKHLRKEESWDLERFDGNAMAFRVVAYKEYYVGEGGMRLTYPTLGALLKYPWTSDFAGEDHKFSCFKTECDSLSEIAGELGLIEKTHGRSQSKLRYARHPLAYLVEAADDICYHVLDIEDAIELNLLPHDYLKTRFEKFLCRFGKLSDEQKDLLKGDSISWSNKNGLLRGKIIGCMIEEIVRAFKEHYEDIMKRTFEDNLRSKTKPDSFCHRIHSLYKDEKLKDKIYKNARNVPLELGAYYVLSMLLENSIKAAYEIFKGKDVSYKTEIVKKFVKQDKKDRFKDKRLYEIIMLFLDYVTGMTDSYATYINQQLLGLGN